MNDQDLVPGTLAAAARRRAELAPIEPGDYSQLYRDDPLGDLLDEVAAVDAEIDRYKAALDAGLHPRTADEVARHTTDRVWLREPLTSYRSVLGDTRSHRLEAPDMAVADQVSRLDRDQLLAERDRAATAFDRLDRQGALATQRVEHELGIADRAAVATWLATGQTAARIAELGWLRGRRERRVLREALAVQRQLLVTELEAFARLEAAAQSLRDAGRDLDDWLAEHAADVVVWIAAERELAARREINVSRAVELAAIDPPDRVREQIGDRPALDALQLEDWQRVARRLEHDRLVATEAIADGSTAGLCRYAVLDLERDARQLRAALGNFTVRRRPRKKFSRQRPFCLLPGLNP
jgi:hypothetical protein